MNKLSLIAGWTLWASVASAQTMLPDVLSFNLLGSFANPVAEGSQPQFVTDNNLFNGYTGAFDLTDAPPSLTPSGPVGSAAFQWGKASPSSAYPHPSALWFEPLPVIDAAPEVAFTAGFLYYRNGTIFGGTGASSVDLNLALTFDTPAGIPVQNLSFRQDLLNTVNSADPIASADIVRFGSLAAPINFMDEFGSQYFLELTFRVDEDATDGTLSTMDQFRVFEGDQGKAELIGRFTTTPIPEPSSLLLAAGGGVLLLVRRRRFPGSPVSPLTSSL